MPFPLGLCGGSSEGVRWLGRYLKGKILERRPQAACKHPSSALRLCSTGKPLTSGSSKSTRDSWGHKQSKSSRHSYSGHSGFSWANQTCCLENSKSNKCLIFFPLLPKLFFFCHCLNVTIFHLDVCVHSLIRRTMPIWGWWFYYHLTGKAIEAYCIHINCSPHPVKINTARQALANAVRVEVTWLILRSSK